MTRKDEAALAPSDRAAMLRWVCHENPILSRVLELLFDRVTDNKRQRQLYSVKDANIHDWNDPFSGAQVFVANINTMSVGVNMHHCCFTGIFINWRLNMKTNWQCCGRLIRIGQQHKVEWIFLKIKNSYHDNIERLAISKWAPQLSAEINLPD
ncbi:hypothetical protein NXS19_013016 [Fusarium pseudograminearum]|nr:hypothetical protein NXS19_013016 [Fusarium pseudograminearum]